jgi:hypothetical protein
LLTSALLNCPKTPGDKTITVVGRNIRKGGVNDAVDSYPSTSHRDAPTPICPLAALGSEVARSGGETKAAATEVLEKLLVTLSLTVSLDPRHEVMRSSPSPP